MIGVMGMGGEGRAGRGRSREEAVFHRTCQTQPPVYLRVRVPSSDLQRNLQSDLPPKLKQRNLPTPIETAAAISTVTFGALSLPLSISLVSVAVGSTP